MRQQYGDHAPLALTAENTLAAIGEDLLDVFAGGRLDLVIRMEKAQTKSRRQSAADLGLSAPIKPTTTMLRLGANRLVSAVFRPTAKVPVSTLPLTPLFPGLSTAY